MQQPPQMLNAPMDITTEQIQKYLDENTQLILAILENQNLGKSAESTLYQEKLQQNLMYLAKIADAQPQGSKTLSQMPTQSSAQQEHCMQPSQAATPMSQQQLGLLSSKLPFSSNDQQQQQQQLNQGQMGMRLAKNG